MEGLFFVQIAGLEKNIRIKRRQRRTRFARCGAAFSKGPVRLGPRKGAGQRLRSRRGSSPMFRPGGVVRSVQRRHNAGKVP